MGYLDNSTIVVDAVLTKEGRRLLSEGQGLDIQYFTLSDSSPVYNGVSVEFDIVGSAGEGQYQLTIPDATALSSISAGNYGAQGWSPQSLSNEDGQSVTYLQNIESADAAFYNLAPGSNTFSLVFKRATNSAVMDCSLISLNTGITKTFRLNITAI